MDRHSHLQTGGPEFDTRPAHNESSTLRPAALVGGAGVATGVTPRPTLRGENISRAKRIHSHARRGQKSPEYLVWESMCRRCHNPRQASYKTHGARGIRVCEAWRGRGGFLRFLSHVGPMPFRGASLDRINNDGNYEPGNVRWVTASEQARNRRSTRLLTAQGRTQCLEAWARELGVSHASIIGRLRRGWSEEDAVTLPKGARGRVARSSPLPSTEAVW